MRRKRQGQEHEIRPEFRVTDGRQLVRKDHSTFFHPKPGKLVLSAEGRKKLYRKLGILEGQIMKEEEALSRYPIERIMLPGAKTRSYSYEPVTYAPILSILETLLKGLNGKSVLELGAGGKAFLLELRARGATPSALDERPGPREKGIDWHNGRIENLHRFFRGKQFNAVVAKFVLESGSSGSRLGPWRYREARLKALRDINRRLRKGGLLVIEMLNFSPITVEELKEQGFRTLFFRPVPPLNIEPNLDPALTQEPIKRGGPKSTPRLTLVAVKIKDAS